MTFKSFYRQPSRVREIMDRWNHLPSLERDGIENKYSLAHSGYADCPIVFAGRKWQSDGMLEQWFDNMVFSTLAQSTTQIVLIPIRHLSNTPVLID